MPIPFTALLFLTPELKQLHWGKYGLKNISDLAQEQNLSWN